MSGIAITCPILVERGKKIPGKVVKVLAEELETAKGNERKVCGGRSEISDEEDRDGEESARNSSR